MMKKILAAIAMIATMGGASAADADAWYLTPGVTGTLASGDRMTEDGGGLAVGIGLPLNDSINVEADLGYSYLDPAGLASLDLRVLNYVDRGNSGLYVVFGVGAQSTNSHPIDDYTSAVISTGLGLDFTLFNLPLRAEGLLRTDRHGQDAVGGSNSDFFIEPTASLRYIWTFGGSAPASDAPTARAVEVVDVDTTDSDYDGVFDSSDVCPQTPAGVAVDASGCAADSVVATETERALGVVCRRPLPGEATNADGCAIATAVILNGVNFEFDSARLTEEARVILDDVAQALSVTVANIEVAGHTSDEGNSEYNATLSRRRAEAVRRYLIDQGIDGSRLWAQGYGDLYPVAPNDSEINRERNRRVEVKVIE